MNKRKTGNGLWIVATWLMAAMIAAGCAAAAPQASMSENVAPPQPMAGSASTESPNDLAEAQAPGADGSAVTNRKIIAHAAVTLIVSDTQEAINAIDNLMDGVGGYVASSNIYRYGSGSDEALQGTISLRVPSDKLEPALDALGKLAVKVENSTLNRDDVTDQYTDVDAQIRNLEATEKELLAMLQEVRERPNSTTEDIMSVYRTLTDVRGQIDTLQGRKNMMDNLIALSTIDVTLTPDSANLPIVEEGWRPGVVARDAQRTLVSAMQALGNVVIWFSIVILPMLLIALIPLIIVFFVLRWAFRKVSKPKPKLVAAQPPTPSA
jgi:hypothetical protein